MSVLDGKVAIVTGAGRGLGEVEALELAKLGARVVVNDLGTKSDGSGKDEEPARAVVEEIKKAGGEAVAHFGDVADGNDSKSMFETAIGEFGDLNILVNNAGFCRDKMIFNMEEDEFDTVLRVHVKGHFLSMRHAAAYWRETSKKKGGPIYGRIISTSSEAFIFASVGQPNYAAAKAGIVALTGSTAQACAKYGVTANSIMPRARTRMTDSGLTGQMFAKPEEGFDNFHPVHVAPLVGYLASPKAANISGNVFIVWGKAITVVGRPTISDTLQSEEAWSYDSVDGALGKFFEGKEPIKDSFIVSPI
jgi:3-oxoacyl-[acyl-carrier protein] reductase